MVVASSRRGFTVLADISDPINVQDVLVRCVIFVFYKFKLYKKKTLVGKLNVYLVNLFCHTGMLEG